MARNPSASPTLVWVHTAAGLSRRFRTWLDKACKNYDDLLMFGGVVDNVLRRERLEELKGEERTKFTEALMDYERLEDDLAKFITSKSYVDFVGVTDEDLIKWVGDEIVSLGYSGFRERSSQYWLWDLRAEKLPYEKKVRQVLDFYGVPYRMRVPSQEQAEAMLFEFLENVKKWPRNRLVWLVRNVYPLSDDTGGFWTVVRKVVELESLRDAWEDIMRDWKSAAFDALKKTPQFEILKTVLLSEWEAERRLRDYIDEVEKEFLDKYGETIEAPDKVKAEFLERAKEIFAERVAPEEKIRQVYEEIKPFIPAEKVELTRAGLWKAIRWAFLHPWLIAEDFASRYVFPLGFTTEEARAIGAKIMEKVLKKPPPPPIEVQVVGSDYVHDELVAKGWKAIIPIPRLEEALKRPGTGGSSTSELALEMAKRQYDPKDYDMKVVKHYALDPKFPYTVFVREKVPPVPPIRYVKVRFLKEIPAIVGADMKTYGPFSVGDIAELPKVNADILVKQGIATYELVPPVKLTPEETGKLADFFLKKLSDAGVPIPAQYKSEFEKAMDIYKTYDENLPIIEKVADDIIKRVVPPPPPVVPPELPTKEIEILKGVVHMKATEMKIEWTPKLWDDFWREYEARARELWATKGISFVEEEVEDVLRVVAPPPPVVPPEKRPLKEFPAEVDTMRDRLIREAEEVFSAYKIWEHWVAMRDSVVAMIDEVIRKYWHLPFVEAERVIHKEFMDRMHEEFVKKLRPPPPPKPPPPEVAPPPPVPRPPVYPYIPPALEYVELEADFKKFLEECGITMEDYRRLETVGRITMREEYRRWKARPYSS